MDMDASSSFDFESLQKLLSNAFVVQESGMDTESLSAIVKLQGSIATGEFDMDKATEMIALCARNVADANGIAIGLLKGDRLVYRAGIGSAAKYAGQHVMATLCVSAHNAASGEILRVENARTDARIEAAICRQFGAQALLILPIYHDRAVAGVLEVFFGKAHAFQSREVRTYRLMAGLVEEAMSYTGRPEGETTRVAILSTMQKSIGAIRPQIEKPLNDGGSILRLTTKDATRHGYGDSFADSAKVLDITRAKSAAKKRAKRVPLYGRETAVAVAAVLVLACWIAYRDHRPAPTVGAFAVQRSNPIGQQMPIVHGNPVLQNRTPEPPTALGLKIDERKAARVMKRWVSVGNNELDYVTQDVTVRYFRPNAAQQRVLDRNNQVRHISEDVTVRYFTPQPALQQTPAGSAAQPVRR